MHDKLKLLENNIIELKNLKQKYVDANVKVDKMDEWALRYGLFESIQIIIDIACHLVAKYDAGNPETYTECIELLERNGYLNSEISEKLIGMIGLRNILVHEYTILDLNKLKEFLENLRDFSDFVDSIKQFIWSHEKSIHYRNNRQNGSDLAELLLSKGYEVHRIIRRASTFNKSRIDHRYRDPHVNGIRLFRHYRELSAATHLIKLF